MRTPALAGALLAALAIAGCSRDLVVLLPEQDGRVGALAVEGGSQALLLDRPFAGARSGLLGGVQPVAMSEQQVRAEFAAALDAEPPPPSHYTLYFEEGRTDVVPASRPVLERMLAEVRERPVAEVQVTGHTDRLGSVEDNDRLARQRATMVRAVLLRLGLATGIVRAVGRGEREPLVATADGVREPRNRRVTVTVR